MVSTPEKKPQICESAQVHMKYLATGILLSLFLLGAILREWPDQNVHIIFCDVGQGDAILITHAFTQLLVDGGKDSSVLHCLENNLPFWDKKIEVVLATHPDADHIGGLASVFEQFSTDLIIYQWFV